MILTLGDLRVELQQGEELVCEELPGPSILLQVEPVVDQSLPAQEALDVVQVNGVPRDQVQPEMRRKCEQPSQVPNANEDSTVVTLDFVEIVSLAMT